MIEFDPRARRAVAPVYHPEELSGALRSVVRCSAYDSEALICVSGSEVAFLPEQRKPLIAPPPFACQTPQPVLSRFSLTPAAARAYFSDPVPSNLAQAVLDLIAVRTTCPGGSEMFGLAIAIHGGLTGSSHKSLPVRPLRNEQGLPDVRERSDLGWRLRLKRR